MSEARMAKATLGKDDKQELRDHGEMGWKVFFSPRSVAVIGASPNPGNLGGQIVHSLHTHGYEGIVTVVNPRGEGNSSIPSGPVPGRVTGRDRSRHRSSQGFSGIGFGRTTGEAECSSPDRHQRWICRNRKRR